VSISKLLLRAPRALRALAALICAGANAGCGATTVLAHGEVAHPITKDGWPLTIEHFPPAPGSQAKKRPVILCHGVLANRRFFEIEGDASLPAVLTRDGFDVWLVDMRGRPDAGAPGWYFGAHTYDYDLDAFIREDVDAMLTYVVQKTGARDVAWVGHSLGGMVAYARLGAIGDPRIGALVTVGSPGFFPPASHNLIRFYELSPALAFLPVLPTQALASVEASLGLPLAPRILKDTVFQTENIPPDVYRTLEEVAVNDAAKPEMRQFLRGVLRGEFVSADGKISYTETLSRIETPTLVIVGRADELADPLVGRGVYERLASRDKELVVAGRAEGFSTDFGHVDLLIGPPARREIFPRIVRWLEEHDER
jgi:pimeloyl-ACP methyl ester carboxylesterase